MPTYIRQLTANGLFPVDYVANSLADAIQYEPQSGIYTVTNTYQQTKVLKFDAHLDRMENSAKLANIPFVLNRDTLRQALREMILACKFGDVRFRVTVGANAPDVFIITLEPFIPQPADVIEKGVICVTSPNSARTNPLVKSTEWMHQRDGVRKIDVYETLLLNEDWAILEGTSSNFYAIWNNPEPETGLVLYTANEGVLGGIARQIVLEVVPKLADEINVRLSPITIWDIPHISEAFITSSSRGIIPVVKIDEHVIGDGKVGQYTQRLRRLYQAWVESHLEEL